MNLLKAKPGYAIAIAKESDETPLIRFSMTGWDSENVMALITGVAASERINHYIAKTFSSARFIYPFGEDVGDVAVQGVAFARSCFSKGLEFNLADILLNKDVIGPAPKDQIVPGQIPPGRHGLRSVIEFFKKQNVSANPKPISVVLGDISMSAFLISHDFQLHDTDYGLAQFMFKFRLLDITVANQ